MLDPSSLSHLFFVISQIQNLVETRFVEFKVKDDSLELENNQR